MAVRVITVGSQQFENLRKAALDIEPLICARCGFCTFVCPAYLDTLWDSQSPRGKLYQLRELIKKKQPIPADFAERIFRCTLCGACQEICQTKIPLLHFWQIIRQEVNLAGHWPEIVHFLDKNIQQSQNIMDLDQEDRTIWADMVDDIVEGHIGKAAATAYFVGCNISFKGSLASIAENTVKLFNHLDIDFTILGEKEFCCGNPYFVAGEWDKAREIAKHHLEELKRLGVKRVVFNCPGCHRAFNEEYSHLLGEESTKDFEFIPFSQFVAMNLRDGRLKFTKEYSHVVTWHDPCELGRHQNIYDYSREVLAAIPGLELREMKHTRNKSDCCGGGGLLKGTNPTMSVRISARRLESAEKTGAEFLLSECPSCMMSFFDGIEYKHSKIQFKDLSEIVAEALDL